MVIRFKPVLLSLAAVALLAVSQLVWPVVAGASAIPVGTAASGGIHTVCNVEVYPTTLVPTSSDYDQQAFAINATELGPWATHSLTTFSQPPAAVYRWYGLAYACNSYEPFVTKADYAPVSLRMTAVGGSSTLLNEYGSGSTNSCGDPLGKATLQVPAIITYSAYCVGSVDCGVSAYEAVYKTHRSTLTFGSCAGLTASTTTWACSMIWQSGTTVHNTTTFALCKVSVVVVTTSSLFRQPKEPTTYWSDERVSLPAAPAPSGVTCAKSQAASGGGVTFTGAISSSAVSGESYLYAWTFGDGSAVADGLTQTHTYTLSGSPPLAGYVVSFTVSAIGNGVTYTKYYVVSVVCALTVVFPNSDYSGGGATSSSSGGTQGTGGSPVTCSGSWLSDLTPLSDLGCALEALFVPSQAAENSWKTVVGVSTSSPATSVHSTSAKPATTWLASVVSLVVTVPEALLKGVDATGYSGRNDLGYCESGYDQTCTCPSSLSPHFTIAGHGTATATFCGSLTALDSPSEQAGWLGVVRDVLSVAISLTCIFGLFHLFRKTLNIGR